MLLAYELDAFLEAGVNRIRGFLRQEAGGDDGQRQNRSEKGDGVQSEAPLLAESRQGLAGERRADHDGYVELDRIQRDGVGHVLLLDQGRNQRLISGAAEGLRESRDER